MSGGGRNAPSRGPKARSRVFSRIAYLLGHDNGNRIAVLLGITDTLLQAETVEAGELRDLLRLLRETSVGLQARNEDASVLVGLFAEEREAEELDVGDILASLRADGGPLDPVPGETIRLSAPFPRVAGREERLRAALRALALNAREHGVSERVVECGLDGESPVLIFRDNGDGVPEEKAPFLFSELGELEAARRHGLGMGTALVRAVAESMDAGYGWERREGHTCFFLVFHGGWYA